MVYNFNARYEQSCQKGVYCWISCLSFPAGIWWLLPTLRTTLAHQPPVLFLYLSKRQQQESLTRKRGTSLWKPTFPLLIWTVWAPVFPKSPIYRHLCCVLQQSVRQRRNWALIVICRPLPLLLQAAAVVGSIERLIRCEIRLPRPKNFINILFNPKESFRKIMCMHNQLKEIFHCVSTISDLKRHIF